MKFLTNENFPQNSAKKLKKQGHDAKSVVEEKQGIKGIEVIKCPVPEKRVILTFDRDLITKGHIKILLEV